ncbi:MAG TPA: hypothetical protein VII19_11165 [Acidimicrobiales bacterium]
MEWRLPYRFGETATVAFGQQPGPPASPRQLQELTSLLAEAGHTGFRDARGPMGFTQRQAAGRFTREEATAFIDQLQDAELDPSASAAAGSVVVPSAGDRAMGRMPSDRLAAELRRRGWTVTKP